MNEPEIWSYTDQGGVLVEAKADTDFFQDPAGKHIRATAPFLSMPVPGDFEITTQLTVDMKNQYDSGCLMVMADDRNWCKICFEYDGKAPTIVSVVTRDGSSDDCNSVEVSVPNPYLRIRKVEGCISFFYSPDGEEWKLIRYFGMPIQGELRAWISCSVADWNGLYVSLFIRERYSSGLDRTFLIRSPGRSLEGEQVHGKSFYI